MDKATLQRYFAETSVRVKTLTLNYDYLANRVRMELTVRLNYSENVSAAGSKSLMTIMHQRLNHHPQFPPLYVVVSGSKLQLVESGEVHWLVTLEPQDPSASELSLVTVQSVLATDVAKTQWRPS